MSHVPIHLKMSHGTYVISQQEHNFTLTILHFVIFKHHFIPMSSVAEWPLQHAF